MNSKKIKFIDLFGGIGGFRLGLEKAGNFKCVFYSDIDKYSVKIYNKNFGENNDTTDIRTINSQDIPDHDLLCAGFPCQPFSIAGKQRGFADTRGTLFHEIARILEAKKPSMFLLENVKGLLNHDKGRTFATIIQTLSQLGYVVEWELLDSQNFGVPQHRERVFIIGHLGNGSRRQVFPIGNANKKNITENVISHGVLTSPKKLVHCAYKGSPRIYDKITPTITTPSGGGHLPYVMLNSHKVLTKDLMMRDGRDNRSCLRSGRTFEIGISGKSIRRLTPVECERLQSFPDNWTQGVSDTQRYKQLGNSVTVNVIKCIGEKIFRGVKNDC